NLLGDGIEPIYTELPGHGRCPAEGDCTISAIAQRLRMAIGQFTDRPIIVVGASLGGLVGLSLADGSVPHVKGVIAGGPALGWAKRWPVRGAVRRYAAHAPRFIQPLVDAALAPRDYYAFIVLAAVPTLIITGDVPLWPQRSEPGVNLIDDGDIDTIR